MHQQFNTIYYPQLYIQTYLMVIGGGGEAALPLLFTTTLPSLFWAKPSNPFQPSLLLLKDPQVWFTKYPEYNRFNNPKAVTKAINIRLRSDWRLAIRASFVLSNSYRIQYYHWREACHHRRRQFPKVIHSVGGCLLHFTNSRSHLLCVWSLKLLIEDRPATDW